MKKKILVFFILISFIVYVFPAGTDKYQRIADKAYQSVSGNKVVDTNTSDNNEQGLSDGKKATLGLLGAAAVLGAGYGLYKYFTSDKNNDTDKKIGSQQDKYEIIAEKAYQAVKNY